MSKTKFTPGPWRVEQNTALVWGNCHSGDESSYGMGYPVAETQRHRPWRRTSEPSDDEVDANAALIAAAPDLYAALEYVTRTVLTQHVLNDYETAALEKACAALAKARGEA